MVRLMSLMVPSKSKAAAVLAASLALAQLLAPVSAAAKVELVMFRAQACSYCEAWDHDIGEIYHLTDEGEQAPLRKVHMEDDLPGDMENIKPVIYSPTFVLMQDDQEVGRIMGYPGPDFFWPLLNEMMGNLKR